MTLLLTDADIDRVLTMHEVLPAIEETFRLQGQGQVSTFPREKIHVPGGFLAFMGGGNHYQGMVGLKCYTHHDNEYRFYVLLFDARTSELLLITRAGRLGELRTGAASGVAARYLARESAATIGMIGAGVHARTQLEAICSVRAIREVKAFSRTPENRQRYAREMEERLGVPVTAVDTSRAAVEGSDIVVCITTAQTPVLEGGWLAPGALVIAPGNAQWDAQEVDQETIRRSDLIVVDTVAGCQDESGELRVAVERGALLWEQLHELGDVVAGRAPGRTSDGQIILLKSVGMGPLDVAAAKLAYERARERGVGVEVEF